MQDILFKAAALTLSIFCRFALGMVALTGPVVQWDCNKCIVTEVLTKRSTIYFVHTALYWMMHLYVP